MIIVYFSFSTSFQLLTMKTTDSQIKSALRIIWLRSRERAECLKKAGYCCVKCGVKKSTKKGKEQKVEVHHRKGILNWQEMYEAIRKNLLCDDIEVLCPDCHEKK